jgi:Rhodopirellula transposase DDE domain
MEQDRASPVRLHHHELARQALVSHQVIVQLIGSTTTETGLKVCCELDANLHPKGIKVSDAEMQAINITRDEFHGEWNYTISPNQQPP